MTRQIAFEILRLALDVTKSQTDGKINQDAAVAAALIEIIRKAREADEAHTGELLDPSLIRPEQALLVREPQQ